MPRWRDSSQKKEEEENTARDPSKTDTTNKPDREFKTMIIRIVMGLEKIVEDMSETLNTEIRNNIAEIKDSINEMRNTLHGMSSRLEEAEERINDLEDRVMESNQAEQKRGKKELCKMRTDLGSSVTSSNIIPYYSSP